MPKEELKNNTMGKDAFGALILLSSIITWVLYFLVLFKELPHIGKEMSVLFFFFLQAAFTSITALALYEKYRTPQNAVLIVLLPQLIYFGITTLNILSIAIGVLVLIGLYILIQKWPTLYDKIRPKDPFEKLSYTQRLDVLCYILKKEIRHLNIHIPVQLVTTGLVYPTHASYCPATGLIEINKYLVCQECPDSLHLASVIAHETLHVLQMQRLREVNAERFNAMSPKERCETRQLVHELLHYRSAEVGIKEYANQLMERQAREYAAERKRYYSKHLPAIVAAYQRHCRETQDTNSIGGISCWN